MQLTQHPRVIAVATVDLGANAATANLAFGRKTTGIVNAI